MSYNVVEEFTSIGIFHDHVELFFGFNNFIKLNDIWMSHFFQNLDFSSNSFNVFLIVNFIFFKDFNSNLII
jgi:hypothetical protein